MTYREFVVGKMNPDVAYERQPINAALGLAGEAGEFADLVKKWQFQGHQFDRDKAIKELGDVRFYLELAAWAVGTTLDEIEQANRDKLNARFKSGFSVDASVNRKPD